MVVMIVRVTCPRCGDLSVPVDGIAVQRDGLTGDTFRFDCGQCGLAVEKRAVGRVADMLLAAGAAEDHLAPLPLADLLDLRADLDADDWLERLLT